MAIYVISDPHLSFGANKPMNIFSGWENYEKRLADNWTKSVSEADSVIIPGDISWAMNTEEVLPDLQFLNGLPGQKILLKGNHDLWWPISGKFTKLLADSRLDTIRFIFRNAFLVENIAVCGTRSWFYDSNEPKEKVFVRELMRLESSLIAADSLDSEEIVAFLHYPPIFSGMIVEEVIELLKKYDVRRCYYGHIHGKNIYSAFNGDYEGIKFKLVSADALLFNPIEI